MHPARRRYFVAVLMVALFTALPILAWLQYRWIGEAGRAEVERTQASLRRSADQFASEFNAELERFEMLVLAAGPLEENSRIRYGERWNEWHALTPHPGLVKEILVTEGGESGLDTLYKFDPANNAFEKIEWPPDLATLRQALLSRLRAGPGFPPMGPPDTVLDLPILVWPRSQPQHLMRGSPPPEPFQGPEGQHGPPPGERFRPARNEGWAIAWLDTAYIRSTWLPELARKYFVIAGQPDYDLRILSRRTNQIVYESNSSTGDNGFRKPDAEAFLFPLRGGSPGPPDSGLGAAPPMAGRWRLQVRDRSGSIENAVARGRARNLAVSGAVLLIMAASLVALLFAMRRADQLAAQQMQFVAAVSHELRTPLSVIRSAAENLADGIVTSAESVKQYGGVIREEGRRLSFLVEQTLRFAGIQTGRARYNLTPVHVSTVLDDAMKSCEGIVRTSNCKVEVEVPHSHPRVLADPSALAVCVGNLLTNAAKHAGAGKWIGVRVTTSANGSQDRVRIEVHDHGPGIDARDLPHIFDPFYRGRRAESQQVAGTGLGLALVRQIITAHNGEITVDSRAGEGSCFTLSLPAVTAPEPQHG